MDFGDRSDNPFSVSLQAARTPRKQALKSAIRFFLLVSACLAICLVITSEGPKWLVHRLTRDFATLSAPEKKERLGQIAELGPPAIPWLVQSMADPDIEVGRAAYELLRQSQNNWSVLEESERAQRHSVMVHSIQSIAIDLPEDRTGWGASLLQQTVMTTVDGKSERARQFYRDANHAIESLSLSSRSAVPQVADAPVDSTLSIQLDDDSQDSRQPKRLAVRAQPLPVGHSQDAELWTQWPPANEIRFRQDSVTSNNSQDRPNATSQQGPPRQAESPSVYRSGAKLQPVAQGAGVELNAFPSPEPRSVANHTAGTAGEAVASDILPVAHLGRFASSDLRRPSVMRWLSSEHAALREKAEAELRRRGYGDSGDLDRDAIVSAEHPNATGVGQCDRRVRQSRSSSLATDVAGRSESRREASRDFGVGNDG